MLAINRTVSSDFYTIVYKFSIVLVLIKSQVLFATIDQVQHSMKLEVLHKKELVNKIVTLIHQFIPVFSSYHFHHIHISILFLSFYKLHTNLINLLILFVKEDIFFTNSHNSFNLHLSSIINLNHQFLLNFLDLFYVNI